MKWVRRFCYSLVGTIAAITAVAVALKVLFKETDEMVLQFGALLHSVRNHPELSGFLSEVSSLFVKVTDYFASVTWYEWMGFGLIVLIANAFRLRLYVLPRRIARDRYREQIRRQMPRIEKVGRDGF